MSIVIPGGLSVGNIMYGDATNARTEVRVATTANGTLATAYANGQTVDGVTLATNDRILLKDQTTGSENGIYEVQATGAPQRAPGYDTGENVANRTVWVKEGTTNAGRQFVQRNDTTVGNALDFGIESDPANTVYDNNFTAGNVLVAGGGNVLDEQGALQILDGAGLELLKFTATASAVNEVTITNAATGTNPIISGTGTDADVGLILQGKGDSDIRLEAGGTGSVVIEGGHSGLQYEGSTSGTLDLTVPATITSYTLTYPSAQGGSGETLLNDGSGNLTWGAPTSASKVVWNNPFEINVNNNTHETILYMPWDHSTYSAYNSGQLVFEVVHNGGRDLIVQVLGTTPATLLAEQTYSTSGLVTVALTATPTADSRVQVQVRYNGTGPSPELYGMTLEWLTS